MQTTLERLFVEHARPELIRSDNGKEFVSVNLVNWLAEQGVTAVPVAKASPQQNCHVERFNGIMRDELIDGELFHSVLEAKVVISRFIAEYNNDRPHRSHGMRAPVAFGRAERARLAAAEGGGV